MNSASNSETGSEAEAEPLTFSELDRLCDLDPLELTKDNLDRLIAGMRAYRANALSKGGKATKFSDEAGITIDVKRIAASVKLTPEVSKLPRRRI